MNQECLSDLCYQNACTGKRDGDKCNSDSECDVQYYCRAFNGGNSECAKVAKRNQVFQFHL
jgi:hypothetical protein